MDPWHSGKLSSYFEEHYHSDSHLNMQQEWVVINQYFEDFLGESARDGFRPKLSQSG